MPRLTILRRPTSSGDITTHIPLQAGAQLAAAAVLENKVSLQVDPRTAQIPGLSIHSEELFEVTTAPIGSLGLCIKACVLIGRVVTFLQRKLRFLVEGESPGRRARMTNFSTL